MVKELVLSRSYFVTNSDPSLLWVSKSWLGSRLTNFSTTILKTLQDAEFQLALILRLKVTLLSLRLLVAYVRGVFSGFSCKR